MAVRSRSKEVTHAFEKLGINSRVTLTRIASEHPRTAEAHENRVVPPHNDSAVTFRIPLMRVPAAR
jgi:hypothetical protein